MTESIAIARIPDPSAFWIAAGGIVIAPAFAGAIYISSRLLRNLR